MPVNLKEQDAFHLTIEEYLLALISMVEELVSCLAIDFSIREWGLADLVVVGSSCCQLGHSG